MNYNSFRLLSQITKAHLRLQPENGDAGDVSENYYEADSGSPSLAISDDYLYLVYLDNGDFDQENNPNGNDAANIDGDVYFARSDDEGDSWESFTVLSAFEADAETDLDYASTTLQYKADITASGDNVHAHECSWIINNNILSPKNVKKI